MTATPRTDKIGNVTVPVAAGGSGVSLASTCDPALTGLLADFKAIINTKLDAAWIAAAGKTMAPHVVVDAFPHEPTAAIINRTWLGPALFMWRTQEREFQRTQHYEDCECTVKILYVMPPMPEDLMVKLDPIRVAVRTTLVMFVEHFGDPTLHPNGDLLSSKGIELFNFTQATYGYFPGLTSSELDLPFPALDMTALMRERASFVMTQYPTATRIDTTITSKDDTGETTVAETYYTP